MLYKMLDSTQVFTQNVFYSFLKCFNRSLDKIIYVISVVSGKLKTSHTVFSYQLFGVTRHGDIQVIYDI